MSIGVNRGGPPRGAGRARRTRHPTRVPPTAIATVWVSPFRAFGLAGVAYGVALIAAWTAAQAGLAAPIASSAATAGWHGHEMLFGFAGAIVCAIVLTALPGWAGTPELRGAPLAGLFALWLAARAGYWAQDALPSAAATALACAPWAVLAALLAVQLARVAERTYLALFAVVAAILAAEALSLSGHAARGQATMIHALVVLYALAAGLFTPVFTGNHLRRVGRGDLPPVRMPLEVAAVASIVAYAALDLAGAPASVRGGAAYVAAALNAWRMARWRGWRVPGEPLLWTMHAGYAWLVVSLALAGLAAFGDAAAARAWLHAYTVGALGSMMIGLLTRVVLRHTGRPLVLPVPIVAAHGLVQIAALARVGAALAMDARPALVVAGVAWTLAFALYLASFGAYLVRPSLPRDPNPLADDSRAPPAAAEPSTAFDPKRGKPP